jgi:tRNA threonylcarbamoyladenosine biosynthesis protein TsaB
MIVLGIETSSRWSGAALVGPAGPIGASHLWEGSRTEHLHLLIVRLLEAAGITPRSIGGIACSLGPGSFTGLRIGLGAAKGISLATGCPVLGLPLPPLLMEAAGPWDGETAVWIDAGRGEVHATIFRGGVEVGPGSTGSPEKELGRVGEGEVLFVGTGALRYRSLVEERLGERGRILAGVRNHPDAMLVALRGAERLRAGERGEIDLLEPLYLRGAEARAPTR